MERLLASVRPRCWPIAASPGSRPSRPAAALAESSPAIVTALNRFIGYEDAAKVAKQAVRSGLTIREAVIARGYVERGEIDEEQLDRPLDVRR